MFIQGKCIQLLCGSWYFYVSSQLLDKDQTKRLCCGPTGAEEIKEQPLFKSINWKRLEAGKMTPPFEPDVSEMTPRFSSVHNIAM